MFQTDSFDPDVLEALFSQKVREIREEIDRRTSLGEAVIFGNEAQVRKLCGEIREIVESVTPAGHQRAGRVRSSWRSATR